MTAVVRPADATPLQAVAVCMLEYLYERNSASHLRIATKALEYWLSEMFVVQLRGMTAKEILENWAHYQANKQIVTLKVRLDGNSDEELQLIFTGEMIPGSSTITVQGTPVITRFMEIMSYQTMAEVPIIT